jgi:hypothetical protein
VTGSSDTPSESAPSGVAPAGAVPPSAPAEAERPPAEAERPPASSEQAAAGRQRAPSPMWPALRAAGVDLAAWLMRPRVRLTLTGVLLLLVGGLIAPNTVWTLPLVIVGALMVAVAWIGHRLEGRFAVEWGEAGTQLAFNTTIKAPQPAPDAPALSAAAPARPDVSPPRPRPVPLTEPTRALDDVIEGEAHTVEINVRELKALIAAAEAAGAVEAPAPPRDPGAAGATPEPTTTREADVRDIRIRRLADDGAPTPRPAG